MAIDNQKPSPVGCLNRNLMRDPMNIAKISLRQPFDLHRLDMNTPHGFCFTVSKTEKQFVTDNFERIEQRRELENRKD